MKSSSTISSFLSLNAHYLDALHKTFWQNPFVDIFKHFPLSEKDNVDKQGEISEHHVVLLFSFTVFQIG